MMNTAPPTAQASPRRWRPDLWKLIPRAVAVSLGAWLLSFVFGFVAEGCTRRDYEEAAVNAAVLLGIDEVTCYPGDFDENNRIDLWEPPGGRQCSASFKRSTDIVYCPAHGPCSLLYGLTPEQKSAILGDR